MGVFVVEAQLVVGGAVGARFVVLVVLAEGFVRGDVFGERLAGGEGGFEGGALAGEFGIAEGEGAPVEVVAAFAGLFANHCELELACVVVVNICATGL